jgi:hypothetical protein
MNTELLLPPKKAKPAHKLFDSLIEKYELGSDYRLALEIDVTASSICKMRSGKPVTANLILKVHERFDIPIKEIKGMIPDGNCET